MLRQHFSDAELEALTPRMDASAPTGLAYYPLPSKGERFPVSDPDKEPCISPRPDDDAVFLQGATTDSLACASLCVGCSALVDCVLHHEIACTTIAARCIHHGCKGA